jgi:aspartate/methionine/tyrosine aminotransferase
MDFKILSKTVLYQAFSEVGKRVFQPNKIMFWAGRARQEAEINASIGEAVGPESDIIPGGRTTRIPYYLPGVKDYVKLEPEKMVGYAPICGVPALRDLWENWIIYKGTHGSNLPSGNIDVTGKLTKPAITTGVTDGIFLITRMFLDPGEKIVCANKRWENYDSIINMQNGSIIESFQNFDGNKFNLDGMAIALRNVAKTQKKLVLIVNFPNNPTGYTPTVLETKQIVDKLIQIVEDLQKPLVLIIDDAYEGYVYTPERISRSIFYELVDKHPLLIPIKLDGASKEMFLYGARIAAMTLGIHHSWVDAKELPDFQKEWDNKMQAMIRSTISNSNHYGQQVLIEIMKKGFDNILASRQKIHEILQKRYEVSIAAFNKYGHEKMTMDPPGGGFFIYLNLDGINADKFADYLIVNYKVGTVPLVSKEDGYNGIRVAYVSIPDNQIEETFIRIQKALNTYKE